MLDIVDIAGLAFGGFDDRAHGAAALAVPAFDQVADLRAQPDQRPDLPLAGQPDRVEGVGILRIGHEDGDVGFALAHRHRCELFHEFEGQFDPFRRQIGQFLHRQQRQTQHVGAGFGMVALGHQPQPRDQRQQLAAGFFLQALGAHQIGFLQPPFLKQRGDDAVAVARERRCDLFFR